MSLFVAKDSVVREIWGSSDIILFIFAGAAAEFALNKAVDWLYFTGKLPADPLGRLFSTVRYAKRIVFASEGEARNTIQQLHDIHTSLEKGRGYSIPDWAYRDVLFMLIYYSITAYELLEKKLTDHDKEEVYRVFHRVGMGMGLKDLPLNYSTWVRARADHLKRDLKKSELTEDLFNQYRKHLGIFRFFLLIEAQKMVVPDQVKQLLDFQSLSWIAPLLPVYKLMKRLRINRPVKVILLPAKYIDQVDELDVQKGKNMA